MQYKTLLFDVHDNVAHITLNRPEAANSFNGEVSTDLLQAMTHCDDDPMIRAVLITGAGKMFCGGGDVKAFAAWGKDLPYHLREDTACLHAAISRLTHIGLPVVAAVNGGAVGVGMSLACACDIVIAGEATYFTVAYTRVGLTPDGSGSYFLPRIVGLKRALELMLTNRVLSAQEALEWGIVSKVVPDEELLVQAHALAAKLAAGPTKALAAAKRLLHDGLTNTLETHMEDESRTIANVARTADAAEGVTAFVEKRTPRFKGQ